MKWDILGRVLSALGILSLIAGPLTGRLPLAAAGIMIGVALIVGASLLWCVTDTSLPNGSGVASFVVREAGR